jgi:cytochrome c peroxidase
MTLKMRSTLSASCLVVGLIVAATSSAQPALFKDADLKLGMQLIAGNKCDSCHQGRVGGDGSAIYKPLGRINTPGFLRGMVEQCNTELNLGFFPEEVTAVAAVLNRDHYKFK